MKIHATKMKSIKRIIEESMKKLNPDECVSFVEQNGYKEDGFTFRMADGASSTERKVEKLFKLGKGRKIYSVFQAQSMHGVRTYFKAFDGEGAEISLEFEKNGKFAFGTANYNPNGKMGGDSKSGMIQDEKDAMESLEQFVDGTLFA